MKEATYLIIYRDMETRRNPYELLIWLPELPNRKQSSNVTLT